MGWYDLLGWYSLILGGPTSFAGVRDGLVSRFRVLGHAKRPRETDRRDRETPPRTASKSIIGHTSFRRLLTHTQRYGSAVIKLVPATAVRPVLASFQCSLVVQRSLCLRLSPQVPVRSRPFAYRIRKA